jgi:hypothetical protein
MVSQPQIEFTQYCHELRTISRRDVTQGIKLAKYKKSADAMLKKDPVTANTLLGLVACLEHDMESMHARHREAIGITESCFSLMYYAVSLEKSCLWNESTRYALMALDHDPGNLKLLDATIGVAPLTGRFSTLKRLLLQWQDANHGSQHPSQGHYDVVTDILTKNGLLEKDLKGLLSAIGEALSETDLILQRFHYVFVTERPDYSFIHYKFVIPDQFAALYYEDLVTAKLASIPCHPRLFDAVSFSFENSAVHEFYDHLEKELDDSDTLRSPDPDKMKLIEELVKGVEIGPW